MNRFVQLHVLTSYPPSNLNRDDLGRPKSAIVGGVSRLRISSQSLKRAWRTSEFIKDAFDASGLYGTRTREVGQEWIASTLQKAGVDRDKAIAWSRDIQRAYGEPDDEDDGILRNKQAVHICPAERDRLTTFVEHLARHLLDGSEPDDVKKALAAIKKRDAAKDKKKANAVLVRELGELLLIDDQTAVDIAMFGRMLASNPRYNVEAAVQVSHAFTVHRASPESDYVTAVDDLKPRNEDTGAVYIGETGFGAGVYYLYLCINRELLQENLGADRALRDRALGALLNAVTKVSPIGKQNSFASRAYASYVLAEKGNQQPRSLALAFVKPVVGPDYVNEAITALRKRCENLDKVYGPCAAARREANAETGEGDLDQLIAFVQED